MLLSFVMRCFILTFRLSDTVLLANSMRQNDRMTEHTEREREREDGERVKER